VALEPKTFTDQRGDFVKTFHETALRELGLPFEIKEEFYSTSHKNVVRGMHFQLPPADHIKLVYCLKGAVLDVVVDLRRNSPTFGRAHAEELSETNHRGFYIPAGFAHGFLSLTEGALMIYKTSTVHTPACDAGIHWNSFGFAWPLDAGAPIVSKRDAEFVPLAEFNTPF
jgi:dTDP-4-dehydrorhamnose 3,5-epimerase